MTVYITTEFGKIPLDEYKRMRANAKAAGDRAGRVAAFATLNAGGDERAADAAWDTAQAEAFAAEWARQRREREG